MEQAAEIERLTARIQELETRLSGRAIRPNGQVMLKTGTYWWDLQSRLVVCDDSLAQMFGIPTAEHPIAESVFINRVHVDDRERFRSLSTKALDTGGQLALEYRIVLPSGEVRLVRGQGTTAPGRPGLPVVRVGSVIDITEERRREFHLSRTVALLNASEVISELGTWWRAVDEPPRWSRQMYRIFGYPDHEGPPSRDDLLAQRVHPEDVELVAHAMGLARQDSALVRRIEYRILHPEAGLRSLLSVFHGVRGADSTLEGWCGCVIDQTERLQLEARERRAATLGALTRLAGGLAHDLNNHLMVMQTSLDLLSDEQISVDGREILDDVGLAVGLCTGLTSRLLAFARPSSGAKHRVVLDAIVEQQRWLLRRFAREDVLLEMSLNAVGAHILVRPGDLERLLVELVARSQDAAPDRAELLISTHIDGLDATVIVRDNRQAGPLMAVSLDAARKLAADCGARLSVVADPQGTSTIIELPLAPTHVPAKTTRLVAEVPHGLRLLLVDDNESVRRGLAASFRRLDNEVVEAVDGVDAIEKLRAGVFDGIITDQRMPRMDGLTLLALVADSHPGLPTVLISGDVAFLERPTQTLRWPVLAKPITAQEVLRSLVRSAPKPVTA